MFLIWDKKKYLMEIYLSLGQYKFLLFPHPCIVSDFLANLRRGPEAFCFGIFVDISKIFGVKMPLISHIIFWTCAC